MSAPEDRLAELERRNAELALELRELRRLLMPIDQHPPDESPGTVTEPMPTAEAEAETQTGNVSRRHALRTAGAVAAGALVTGVAAAVSTATPAAAAPLGPVTGDPAITATAQPGNGTAISATSVDGRAIWAVSTTGNAFYGQSTNGDAIQTGSVLGVGLAASSQQTYGVTGISNASAGARFDGYTYGAVGSGVLGSFLLTPQGSAPPLEPNTYARGALTMDQNGSFWVCVTGGTPGTWRQLAGADTAGSFHPLSPSRVYDSRAQWPFPGRISTGQRRTVSTADSRDQNGVVITHNIVPNGANAIFANITVVDTALSGWLAANPGGTTTVSASTINWSSDGQILANGVALAINPVNRNLTVIAGGPGSTDFLIDITGYWM